ncbi:helix-turn-helix domain-containing protein [Sphingomonas sp. CFBP 8760]|uniref:helix-turn-helix domain-containing protein n=1 Tax=Sphingomonas sp. CFBP 8760 TaxID=2775282 RepID=UPI0017822635|nr:helix-turn-helix transcriptional regulator [Sphingomonas sp. CFBP 8760]MBD8548293.1 helix-turn-helix transcriptional regulator [Sphingomonas sp. CFBP 8760]
MSVEAVNASARITPRQRECLEWVRKGYETKEIARVLQLSPDTIDMHVKNAMQRLGAASRREAARMAFPETDADPHQSSVHQSVAIPGPADVSDDGGPDQEGFGQDGRASRPRLGLPYPSGDEQTNELSNAQRLFWILALGFGAAVGFGVVVNSL